MANRTRQNNEITRHRFLDEAGDTAFYGRRRTPIIGIQKGVSLSFGLGMVKFRTPLEPIRTEIRRLQEQVAKDPYYNDDWRVQKKIKEPGGYYFHATDDPESARKVFYEYIKSLDLSFEMVVARKFPSIFASKHDNKETEFYADLLSHLLKNKLKTGGDLVLNIAQRGNATRNANLQKSLDKATTRFLLRNSPEDVKTHVVFNVQTPRLEPLLCITDYLCWSVQRVFEQGDARHYNFINEKISLVIDLYDNSKYENSQNYYDKRNPLTPLNKISPPSY